MLISVNSALRRRRGRLGLVLAALTFGLAVVAAHGAIAVGHMASPMPGHVMDGGGAMSGVLGSADTPNVPGSADSPSDALMAMCLAIAETAALALGALALASALAALLGSIAFLWWPVRPLVFAAPAARTPRARPPDLSVLQVFRR